MNAPRFEVVARVPARCAVLGVPVFADLSTPAGARAVVDRGFLAQRRFDGQPGTALALLADDATTVLALGVGQRGSVDADALRRAGVALARNAGTASEVATTLLAAVAGGGPAGSAPGAIEAYAAAVVAGIGLGAYRYNGAHHEVRPSRVDRAFIVASADRQRVGDGVRLGETSVAVTCMVRDWVNRPPVI
jgi:leucyl aminopeptidase